MGKPVYDTKDIVAISVILSLCAILAVFITLTANEPTTSYPYQEVLYQAASSALKSNQVECMTYCNNQFMVGFVCTAISQQGEIKTVGCSSFDGQFTCSHILPICSSTN